MRESLLQLSKANILAVFCRLRDADTCGFNHELVKKSECVDRLLAEYPEYAIRQACEGLGFDVSGEAPAPAPAPAPQATSSDDANVLRVLRQALGVQVDEGKVREIVDQRVTEALERSPVVRIEVKRPDAVVHKVEGHTRPEFQKVLRRAIAGKNQLFIGPAGCGKTHLAKQVADALGRPFAAVSCTAGMSESQLSGWLLPVEANGTFTYVPSDFVRMYEEGGAFLFDELDAADSNTLLFVNQALANGHFYLPQRRENTCVKRHPDFVCFGAANTFGTGSNMTYAGRERLDESTLDRFRAGMVVLDYDTKLERTACDPELLAWGWSVRKRIADARLSRVMSTRFLLDATDLMAAGETLEEIKETYFIGWKADEKSKVEV